VFTRVGASDNISGGESTFMVEMNETALIMNNISDRSLILLDEIGRGTSTYDGISIAWSLAEYLHDNDRARPKTLFATHYHELNELAEQHERIHNYHVSTREVGHKVIFLRKLVPGGSNHSFGIHVARMAGMPARGGTRQRNPANPGSRRWTTYGTDVLNDKILLDCPGIFYLSNQDHLQFLPLVLLNKSFHVLFQRQVQHPR
jgi:DNA mismatch repair ATPase MutS